MKKIFSFFAIIAIIAFSNCSQLEENNDPIIGIWTNLSTNTASSKEEKTIYSSRVDF